MVFIRKLNKILIGKSEKRFERHEQGGRKISMFILRITGRISFY
jgi:hypothetical protein